MNEHLIQPGDRVYRARRCRPAERGAVLMVLAVGGVRSLFDGLGVGPHPGHALCRLPRPGRRAELVEIPVSDLAAY